MKKIVIKIGSSIIAPQGMLDQRLVSKLVKDVLAVEAMGYHIILVTSGAVASGIKKVGFAKRSADTHLLMALSSIGQIVLMDVYADTFKRYNKLCAQILLTWDDFDHRKRFLNVRQTITKLFALGVIPIINENDAVSFEEIRFGDNDRLSALVGNLIGADILVILSDVEGLMNGKEVVPTVDKIDASILQLVRKKEGELTAGGMATKLEAARIAMASGIKMVIANGRIDNVLSKVASGEHIGTEFFSMSPIGEARKRWIAFSKKVKGSITIDDGAKEALLKKGKSLLRVGIVKFTGTFQKNDAVELVDRNGHVIGCGLTHYSCQELRDSQGRPLEREVIHRDNFVKREV